MVNGTTGAHPRTDSPPSDGPGTRATGIMVAMSSDTIEACGSDSKAGNGSNTEAVFQPSQVSQEVQESADHSISSSHGDSQPPSPKRDFQDAESDKEEKLATTCGKITEPADSLEENLCIKLTGPVRLVSHMSGRESSDVSKDQSSQERDSTTKLEEPSN